MERERRRGEGVGRGGPDIAWGELRQGRLDGRVDTVTPLLEDIRMVQHVLRGISLREEGDEEMIKRTERGGERKGN